MWDEKLADLDARREAAHMGGGQARIDKQHERGKLTARERLDILFDEGTFVEINTLMTTRTTNFGMDKKKTTGDGVVTGYGRVNGRVVFASSQDFTVGGGALGEYHALKIANVMDMAMNAKAPFIEINDSGGARIEEGIDSLNGYAGMFRRHTQMSGVAPQIAVIMGPCAGGACYAPALCDFIFMTRQNGQMYITGPKVIKEVTGEVVTTAELGGADVHMNRSGVAHFVYDDDTSCLMGVRKLLEYLPENYLEKPPVAAPVKKYYHKRLRDIVSPNMKISYNMYEVIDELADLDSFIEVQSGFARNIIVGFIKMEGKTVGVVANQPDYIAGSLDYNAGDKAGRFIRFCDCFNIPILTLVDVPAFLPGKEQEHSGIIRHGAKILYAYSESTVPTVTVILRKAFGGAYIGMDSKGMGADFVFSWPVAEIAVMGAEGAVGIIGKRQIDAAEDPEAKRKELIKEYEDKFMNPYIAAERGYIDEVIRPEETRSRVLDAFAMLEQKQKSIPDKKHGNIPL
ncbi:MAG: acyl-CoA carboxylase subunit beta [Lachnospiraceae bacterium]|nr:acyl-CoA carboxylase subunit beta [Lachnospiraceae bacterium]